MKYYFDKLELIYSKKIPPHPQTSYNEDVGKEIYIGEPDEYEWICWKPVLKTEKHNLDVLYELVNVNIHPSIIEYYNSYWFFTLGGKTREFSIQLDAVLPNLEPKGFTYRLLGYKDAHNGVLENIPIFKPLTEE